MLTSFAKHFDQNNRTEKVKNKKIQLLNIFHVTTDHTRSVLCYSV